MNDKENGLDNVEAMDYSASRGTLTTFSDYPAAGGWPGLVTATGPGSHSNILL